MTISNFFGIMIILLSSFISRGSPRIYLVRHAAVDLAKPGWGSSENSAEYKAAYNIADIETFNPDEVLKKIENHKNIDTLFCSPQPRALETAKILFGGKAFLKTDSVLTELDYPVLQIPLLPLPVKGWLFLSRITWIAGINTGEKAGYKERLDELNVFTDELTKFADRNGQAVIVAHGMLNRELVKILKDRGWKYCKNGKNGYNNLSVNCLELP